MGGSRMGQREGREWASPYVDGSEGRSVDPAVGPDPIPHHQV